MSDESDELAEVIRPAFGDHFERPASVIDEHVVDLAAYRARGGDWTAPARETSRWPWTELGIHPIHDPEELEAAARTLAKRALARGDGALAARLAEEAARRRSNAFTRHFWFEPDLDGWQPTPQMWDKAEHLLDDQDALSHAFDDAIDREDGALLRAIELAWLARVELAFDESGARGVLLEEVEDSDAFDALISVGPSGFALFGWGTPGHPLREKHDELFDVLETIAIGLDAYEWIVEHASAASDAEVRFAARFLLRDLTRMRDRELTAALHDAWKSRFGDAIYLFTPVHEAEQMLEGKLGGVLDKMAVQLRWITLALIVLVAWTYFVIPDAVSVSLIIGGTLLFVMTGFQLYARRVANKYEKER